MLKRETSSRVKVMRFPLILAVVFIHAYGNTVNLSNGEIGAQSSSLLVDVVTNFVSQGVARIAVPIFFLLSGFLFFSGFDWSADGYFKKLKSRSKTLLIPFLFWNVFTLLVFALGQLLPVTKGFFPRDSALIAEYRLFDYFDAIFGITHSPIAYQFWFIRDLMVLVLLTPVIRWVIKTLPASFFASVFVCWVMSIWPVMTPSSEALLFFASGCFLAMNKKRLFFTDGIPAWVGVAYLLLVLVDVLSMGYGGHVYLYRFCILLGVLLSLMYTKFVETSPWLRSILLNCESASFFVFAVHNPSLIILKKLLYKALDPHSPWLILTLYFAVPTLVVIAALACYRVLTALLPRFTSVITGGR